MKNYKCIKKYGPYNGPFQKNLISYFFQNHNDVIVWHTNINNNPNFEIGKCYAGIFTKKFKNKNIVNYKKSKPFKIQLELV